MRCIGSPAHLHKSLNQHVTVDTQRSKVAPLETDLLTLDPQMKLAEVVRRSLVYLLTNNVQQAALLQSRSILIVYILFDLFAAFQRRSHVTTACDSAACGCLVVCVS